MSENVKFSGDTHKKKEKKKNEKMKWNSGDKKLTVLLWNSMDDNEWSRVLMCDRVFPQR